MAKYGIRVEHETGSIYYYGKNLHEFISFNLTTAPSIVIQNENFKIANLETKLIEKYGYATKQNAQTSLVRLQKRYPRVFEMANVTIIELNSSLKTQMNIDAVRKKLDGCLNYSK